MKNLLTKMFVATVLGTVFIAWDTPTVKIFGRDPIDNYDDEDLCLFDEDID